MLRELGLRPARPSFNGRTLHATREGAFQQVADPEGLSPDEREAMIAILKSRLDISSH